MKSNLLSCKYCCQERKNLNSLRQHQVRCKENPDGIKHHMEGKKHSSDTIKKLSDASYKNGSRLTEEGRKRISETSKIRNSLRDESVNLRISASMKIAHREGRAWNIGKSRWNNEPSYPEAFFIKVIENEFDDKDYIREYAIGIYSADFCWPSKKKVIEIDGEQHERFDEYKERDKRKDDYLISKGYQILRISWKDLFNNSKQNIEIAKIFINN